MRHRMRRTAPGVLCGLGILCLTFFFSWPVNGHSLQTQDPSTPTPTLDPTDQAFQAQIEVLTTRVVILESRVDLNKQAAEIQVKQITLPIVIGAAVLAAIGIGSPLVLITQVRKRMESRFAATVAEFSSKMKKDLDAVFYRVDPTYLSIHIPSHSFTKEKARLEKLGFRSLRTYSMLTKAQTRGIVVYMAESKDDIDTLQRFIDDQQLDPERVAFIIYTCDRVEGLNDMVRVFGSIVFANSPVTIATHIYALARVLTI